MDKFKATKEFVSESLDRLETKLKSAEEGRIDMSYEDRKCHIYQIVALKVILKKMKEFEDND